MRYVSVTVASILTIIGLYFAVLNFNSNISEIQGADIAEYWGNAITAIAFVWLIASYTMQWNELSLQREQMRQSTEELREQAKSLAAQVEVSRAQAEAIRVQAEISKQNGAMIAQRDFVASFSSYAFDRISSASERLMIDLKNGDDYQQADALTPFLRGEHLWQIFSYGRQDIIVKKLEKLFKISLWLMTREIDRPLSSSEFQEVVINVYYNLLIVSARYSKVIESLQASSYDQRPFDDLAYYCWEIAKLAKIKITNSAAQDGDEDDEIVSGVEWIKRQNHAYVYDGARYLYEGDITMFPEIAELLLTE